jgi:2-hydroxychromene-2-carboxylate isomerase
MTGRHEVSAPMVDTSGAGSKKLEFWFDFASTYSYVAAMRIEDLCRAAGIGLVWTPFLLGPIFALQGWNDSPFNLNSRRGAYMWRDLARLTRKFGLPWRRPTVFPRASTLAARVACSLTGEPWSGEFVRRIFVENFGHDRDIGDEAVVLEVLRDLGEDGERALARALAPDQRGALRANTERAIALGIFGAPNCVVGDELYWGEESLDDAIALAAATSTSP